MSDTGVFLLILFLAFVAVTTLDYLRKKREESSLHRRVAILEKSVFGVPAKPAATKPTAAKPRARKPAQ